MKTTAEKKQTQKVVAQTLDPVSDHPERKFSRSLHNAPTDDLGRFLMSDSYAQVLRVDQMAQEAKAITSVPASTSVYVPARRKVSGSLCFGGFFCRGGETAVLVPAFLDDSNAPHRITPPRFASQVFYYINKLYSDRKDNKGRIEDLRFSLTVKDCYERFTGKEICELLEDPDQKEAAKNRLKAFRKELVDALWYLMNISFFSLKTETAFHPIGGFSQKNLSFSITAEFSDFLTRRTFEDHELLRAISPADRLLGTILQDMFAQSLQIVEVDGKQWVHTSIRWILFSLNAIPALEFSFEQSDDKEEQKRQRLRVLDIPLLNPLKSLLDARKFRYAFSLERNKLRPMRGGISSLTKEEILELELYFFPLDAKGGDILDKLELFKKRQQYKQKRLLEKKKG